MIACTIGTVEASGAPEFVVQVPPELEGGVYANFMSTWSSPWEFTLDFCATLPAEHSDPDDENSPIRVPCRVVSRVEKFHLQCCSTFSAL